MIQLPILNGSNYNKMCPWDISYIIGVRVRYSMRYSFPVNLIGRESEIINLIGRESQSECISSLSQSEYLHRIRGRYLMRYSFPIYLIGPKS